MEFESADPDGKPMFAHSTEDDENDDEYGEVPDRDAIKKHTTQMLNARLKTKQAKKVKKKRAAKDDDA